MFAEKYFLKTILESCLDFFNPNRHLEDRHIYDYELYERNLITAYTKITSVLTFMVIPSFHLLVDRMALGNSGAKWIVSRGLVMALAAFAFYFSKSEVMKTTRYFRLPLFFLLASICVSVALANLWEPNYIFSHNYFYPVIAAYLLHYSAPKTFLAYVLICLIQLPVLSMIQKLDGSYFTNFEIAIEYFIPSLILVLIKTSHIRTVKKFITEFELRYLQRKIIKKEKEGALGQLACYLTHEINNPLLVILNSTNKVKRETFKEKQDLEVLHKSLERIERNTKRITEVISSIDNLTDLETKSYWEDASINNLLQKSLDECVEDIEKHSTLCTINKLDHDISFGCNPNHITYVITKIIQRLTYELITYPNKSEGKFIKIVCAKRDCIVEFTFEYNNLVVSDHLEDELNQEAFSFKQRIIGKGLNLDIAKLIINEHQGTIAVTRDRSIISICLPILTEHQKKAA